MYLGQKVVTTVRNKAKQILLCCAAAALVHSITWPPAEQSSRLNTRASHQAPATQTRTYSTVRCSIDIICYFILITSKADIPASKTPGRRVHCFFCTPCRAPIHLHLMNADNTTNPVFLCSSGCVQPKRLTLYV